MKRYIGTTDEGEQVFCEWELTAGGKFTANVEYLNKAGTDLVMSGSVG